MCVCVCVCASLAKTHSMGFDADRCSGLSSQIGIGVSAPRLPNKPDTVARGCTTDVVVSSSASAAICDAVCTWVGGSGGEFGFREWVICGV